MNKAFWVWDICYTFEPCV